MARGGARPRSGPPPDPNALRRDRDGAEWTRLPAAGRSGDTPTFPLDRASARELTLWRDEWRRPQAVLWDRLGLHLEVAMFVRDLVAAEQPDASPPSRALVLRHMDSLGISVAGLRAHRWTIDTGTEAEQVNAADDQDRRASAKSRFKTITGGVAS